MMKRATLQKLSNTLYHLIADIEFFGAENIPAQGGVIIATNHIGRLDIPLLFINPTRPDITALVTDKYQNHPFFHWYATVSGGIWIDRTRADFSAFRQAIDALKDGRSLGIAPEGTRSATGRLIEAKSGTALIAIRTGMPVVPVAITGTGTAVAQLMRLQRPHVVARFGKPLIPPPLTRDNREGVLQRFTDEIMCQIAAMLPTDMHGFYAGHPRLQEILDIVSE